MVAFDVNPTEICKYSIIVYGYSLAIDIDQVDSNGTTPVQVVGENYNQTVPYFSFRLVTSSYNDSCQVLLSILVM